MEPKLRIMIVDDDPDLLDMLTAALEDFYEVITAINGLDALERAADCEPDLFIIDIMMPVMSGWELVERLRGDVRYKATPVILLTAKRMRTDIRKGYEMGADLYLTKPFSVERLVRNIEVFEKQGGLVPRPKRLTMKAIAEREARRKAQETPPSHVAQGPATPAPPTGARKMGAAQAKWGFDEDEDLRLDPFSRVEPLETTRTERLASTEKAKAPEEPSKPDAESIEVSDIRILFVDDEVEVLDMGRQLLGGYYELLQARDGLEAIQKANKYHPDVFVIDGMMPRMSGYQLCTVLRQSKEFRNAPIVFMSAKSSPKDRKYVQTLHVTRFLAKPFSPEELVDSIQAVTSDPAFRARTDRVSWDEVMEKEGDEVYLERRRREGELRDSRKTIGGFIHSQREARPAAEKPADDTEI